jgi:hypothetical protein
MSDQLFDSHRPTAFSNDDEWQPQHKIHLLPLITGKERGQGEILTQYLFQSRHGSTILFYQFTMMSVTDEHVKHRTDERFKGFYSLKLSMGRGSLYLSPFMGRKATFIFAISIDCSLRWLFFIYCMMLTLYDEDGKGGLERKAGRT